jgi:hypothetical protein
MDKFASYDYKISIGKELKTIFVLGNIMPWLSDNAYVQLHCVQSNGGETSENWFYTI